MCVCVCGGGGNNVRLNLIHTGANGELSSV